MNNRIVVTGASGFVGTHTTEALLSYAKGNPVDVIRVGRESSCDIQVEIRDKASCVRMLRDTSPTSVIHLAAIAAPAEAKGNPTVAWSVNFEGTVNIASSILEYNPDCRLIFAGSSEVYGASFNNPELLTEETPLQPMTLYGATKAAADVALGQMYYDGLRSVRFRPFNHSGPGQSTSYVLPAFASQVARIITGKSEPVVEVGNLCAIRDFLHVEDVVSAYVTAATSASRQIDGRVFNLSSEQPVSIDFILRKLIALSNMEITVIESPMQKRGLEIARATASSRAAREVLGWSPRHNIDCLIEDVLKYWIDINER